MNQWLVKALISANQDNVLVDSALHLAPKNWSEAVSIQDKVLLGMNEKVGAWKVGVGDTLEGVMSGPLKKSSFRQGNNNKQEMYALGMQGYEVEMAFCISPSGQILHMAPAIEWVQSRFMEWPKIEPVFQWADSLNHGGLWVGLPIAVNENLDWLALDITVKQDSQEERKIKGQNPAGDPRRLLAGFIQQNKNRNAYDGKDLWVTTGSYVGLLPVKLADQQSTTLKVTIQGVGSIEGKVRWVDKLREIR